MVILDFFRDRLVIPVDGWYFPDSDHSGLSRFEFDFLWAELSFSDPPGYDPGPVARIYYRAELYGGYRQLQALLLIPSAFLATLGGLIAMRFRPRRTTLSSPDLRP